MLLVPLGVNPTPMAAGVEDEVPQPDKPRVRRANTDNHTATVARFTFPPDMRELRNSPDIVIWGIML